MKKKKRTIAKIKEVGTAKQRMLAKGFQEASVSDLIRVKREAKKYQHSKIDGAGNVTKIDAPPKDQFFRTRSEGRPKNVTPKKTEVKTKKELWNGNTMHNFFREENIIAERTDWHVFFNEPARKMTNDDQLVILMKHTDTEWEVAISRRHKYLCIEELHGIFDE